MSWIREGQSGSLDLEPGAVMQLDLEDRDVFGGRESSPQCIVGMVDMNVEPVAGELDGYPQSVGRENPHCLGFVK